MIDSSDQTADDGNAATPAPRIQIAPYQPHPTDPPALLVACPICVAPIGAWCGGFGDVHTERSDLVK